MPKKSSDDRSADNGRDSKTGRFLVGNPGGPGGVGTPHHVLNALRSALAAGLEEAGGPSFIAELLHKAADQNPVELVKILAKVIPSADIASAMRSVAAELSDGAPDGASHDVTFAHIHRIYLEGKDRDARARELPVVDVEPGPDSKE